MMVVKRTTINLNLTHDEIKCAIEQIEFLHEYSNDYVCSQIKASHASSLVEKLKKADRNLTEINERNA